MHSVLLVTPDRDLREVAARVLTTAGFEAVTAAHGGHALLACLGPRRFDVLVIEEAPGDTAHRLLRYQPEMEVVRIVGCDSGGAELVRPFIADDLLAAVSVAAARRAFPSSAWF